MIPREMSPLQDVREEIKRLKSPKAGLVKELTLKKALSKQLVQPT